MLRVWAGRRGARRYDFIALCILLAAAGLIYRVCLHPTWFGYYHDDGIYAVTAQALATGQGYRILSLPSEPPQTKYPPVYPFLLSLVWRIYPKFPDNIVPMMTLSLAVTLGFLLLAYYYLVRQSYAPRGTALLIVFLTAFNVMTICLATSVLSEMPYAVLSVAALWLVEHTARPSGRLGPALAAGVAVGLALLTRQIGVSVMAAAVAYLLWRRRYRSLVRIILVVGFVVGPWLLWCRLQMPRLVPASLAYYTSYAHEHGPLLKDPWLLGHVASKNLPTMLTSIAMIWFPTNLTSLDVRSAFDFAFVVAVFALLGLGFIRLWHGGLRLLYLYILFYLAALVLHPFPQYDRYIIPILPFLLLPLLTGCWRQWSAIRNLWSRRRRPGTVVMMALSLSLLLICLSGLFIYNGIFVTRFIRWMGSADRSHEEIIKEKLVFTWIRSHTQPTDVLASFYDPIYYLYTDRKAIRITDHTALVMRLYKGADAAAPPGTLLDALRAHKVRYAIVQPSHAANKEITDLMEKDPRLFVPVYRSADAEIEIYRIDTK